MTRRLNTRGGRRGYVRAGAGGGPTPVDWPLQMAALYPTMGWWDPSQGYALNGSTVSAWVDRINGYALSQVTAGLQPEYSATVIGGHPGIGTDGQLRYLSGASPLATLFAGTAPCTVMQQIKFRSSGTNSLGMVSLGVLASSTACVEAIANTPTSSVLRYQRNGVAAVTGSLALANGGMYTLTSVYSGMDVRLWSGTTEDPGSPFAIAQTQPGLDLLVLGGLWRLAAISGGCSLWGDTVVIPAALTSQQVADGQAWFAARYA